MRSWAWVASAAAAVLLYLAWSAGVLLDWWDGALPGPWLAGGVERVWLGMVRFAGEWEPAAAFADDPAGLALAAAWLAADPEPGETTRSVRRWDIQGAGDTPRGQPGREAGSGLGSGDARRDRTLSEGRANASS